MKKVILFIISVVFIFSCASEKFEHGDWEMVADGFRFPEGPAWDGAGSLYISNCNGGWIARIENSTVDTLVKSSEETFQKTNGLIYLDEGYLLGCEYGENGYIIKITMDGEVQKIVKEYEGQPFNRPNDLTMDKKRNIYFTDPKSYGIDKRDGRVFYYDMNTDQLSLVADSLAFPNGLELSPLDGKLYVCESATNSIISFDVAEDGSLKNKKPFITLPGGDTDGIEFDIKGNLYVAHFGGGAIYAISPQGEIINKIETPGKKPSNLEFGGKDYKTMFITEDETNAVYKMNVSIPGHSLNNMN